MKNFEFNIKKRTFKPNFYLFSVFYCVSVEITLIGLLIGLSVFDYVLVDYSLDFLFHFIIQLSTFTFDLSCVLKSSLDALEHPAQLDT